jgi:teichuronic acid biosynthesis glycosyltransferase TuaH
LHALARHSAKHEYLPSDLMVLRKQAWARGVGFPARATIDKAEKIFNLSLQNTNHSHLIVKNAIADYEGTGENIWIKAFRSGWDEGGLGLFAPVIWKQVRFMLTLGLLIVLGMLLLLMYPALGTILLLLGLTGVPIFRGWRISLGPPNHFLLKTSHSLLAGWIEIIHWIGYIAGVNTRKKERLILDLESNEALAEIISLHPNKSGIVVLSPTVDWTYMFQRYQQMARQFARQNYLVFYHTHNSQSDAFAGFQEVEPGLIVTSVPLETFGTLTQPIFYVNSPWLAPMIAWLKDPIVLYDHCDDISVSSGLAKDHHDLLKHAHLVFASSTKLLMEDRAVREDTIFLPNAVDYDWVVQNMPVGDQAIPEDLRHIIDKKKPIIGYTGALAEWFDYELLTEVCIKCPEMEFVLIGVDYDDTMGKTDLLKCRNVTWLGHKPYQSLFQYVWCFNVAIIPFHINKITLATSPVKLFEYFACQKPVVSTALPECKKYDPTFIAHNADQFRSQLQKALAAGKSEEYIMRVTEIARENTWEARVGKIIDELSNGGRFELQRS